MFHSKNARVSFPVNMSEYVLVVDFTRRRLFAAGIVSRLEIRDFIPCRIDIGYQVGGSNVNRHAFRTDSHKKGGETVVNK